MKAYLLTYDKGHKNPVIHAFSSKAEAGEASFKSTADGKVMVQDTNDLSNLSGPELVELYNMLNGNSDISRFRDLKSGQSKVFATIKGIAESNDQSLNPTGENEVAAAPKKKRVKAEGAKAYSKIDVTKKLDIVTKDNPRREGSAGFKSYALLKQGMKVSTYLENGGRLQDLRWDIAHGNVKLSD